LPEASIAVLNGIRRILPAKRPTKPPAVPLAMTLAFGRFFTRVFRTSRAMLRETVGDVSEGHIRIGDSQNAPV
jgi:hypothetical protein